MPALPCFYTLPNDDAIPQTELPSYIFIQILPIYCSGYSSSFLFFYAVLAKYQDVGEFPEHLETRILDGKLGGCALILEVGQNMRRGV